MSAAPRQLSSLVDYLVDDRVGILGGVQEVRPEAGAPELFHVSAWICNSHFLPYGRPTSGRTGAAAMDRETAVARVVTDAVAFYCAAFRYDDDLVPRSARELARPHVAPADFALFSREQHAQPGFPWDPFDDDAMVHWRPALDPLRDEIVYVPSALVYLPYSPFPGHREAACAPATSTGLACHWHPAAAAVEGLCDAVECDALALAWQARMALPQVRVETLSDANYELVARFERTGASLTLLLADLGLGVPTFLAALTNDTPTAPARVFAAGTDPDPEAGVRKSLEMLAHTLQYAQLLHSQMPAPEPDPPHRNVTDQGSHLKFWCDPANAVLADFLFASHERIESDEVESRASGDAERDLLELLRRLESAGHRALLADVTTPEVGELGLRVLRAVVPGLHPLFYGFHQRALGGARLRSRLGQAADNPNPHPFPRKGVLT